MYYIYIYCKNIYNDTYFPHILFFTWKQVVLFTCFMSFFVARYLRLFRSKLDHQGRPVRYDIFRRQVALNWGTTWDPKRVDGNVILLMAEILHHLGCMKPYETLKIMV